MKRFVEGEDRRQTTLLPDRVDDHVGQENPVRAIEAFAGALDLAALARKGRRRCANASSAVGPGPDPVAKIRGRTKKSARTARDPPA